MTTALDKELKRRIAVDGAEYTVVLDPDGLRLVGKGKRIADVALRWADLLSGETALATALNASLGPHRAPSKATAARKKVEEPPASPSPATTKKAAARPVRRS